MELGVNPVSKVGAVNLGGGILGSFEEKEAALLIKRGGVRAIVAGGEKTGHRGEDIVPSVRLLAELAESLQTLPALLRKAAVIFGRVGDGEGAELLELAGGFRLAGGGEAALDGGDGEAGEEADDRDDDEELDEGKGLRLEMMLHRSLLGRLEGAGKKKSCLSQKCHIRPNNFHL